MKKLLILITMLCSVTAFAISNEAKYELNNHMGNAGFRHSLGSKLNTTPTVIKATYDYATYGGTVGDKSLKITVPSGAIIKRAYAHVLTAVTGGGTSTVAAFVKSAGDLLGATAVASLGSTTTVVVGAPIGTAGTMIVLNTGAQLVRVTVGGAPLTAGKIDFFVEYYDVAD